MSAKMTKQGIRDLNGATFDGQAGYTGQRRNKYRCLHLEREEVKELGYDWDGDISLFNTGRMRCIRCGKVFQ